MDYTDDKKSIYDLSIDYIKNFYTHEPSVNEKKKIIKEFIKYLSIGWNQVEIFKHLESIKKNKSLINDCFLEKALKFYTKDIKLRNLIDPTEIHYHNQLRIFPGRKVVKIDYDKGIFKSSNEKNFLEMRASYTVENLYEYFVSKEDMYIERLKDKKQFIGAFNWLLSKFEVDEILFMIDKAESKVINDSKSLKLKSPLDLKSYIEDGQKALTSKKNALIYNDADNIIPRDRTNILKEFFEKGDVDE